MDDLDYLYSTARIRAMEGRLLGSQRLNELIDARKAEDAIHKLEERGWENPDFSTHAAMDKTIADERKRTFKEIGSFAPDKNMVKLFQLKYDYHNIKTIIKAKALDKDFEGLLSDSGSIEPRRIVAAVVDEDYSAMSPAMKNATLQAKEILSRTSDPFFSDMALDQACYSDMARMAKASESSFLLEYVRLQVDAINLCTAVRIRKRGLAYDYMRQSFINGGSVDISRFLTELTPDVLENAFAASALLPAASAAGQVLRGDAPLSYMDTACANVLMDFLKTAKCIGLGEQPLVAYVAAKEAELTAVRIIFSGKLAGLDADAIKERLRESYV